MSSSERALLAALSARIGADRMLVQGGGGNTSLKEGDTLWVKASGTWLMEAAAEDIFVPLPLAMLRARLAAGLAENLQDLVSPDERRRPSIEASLHGLLPHPVVVHVHAVDVIALASRRSGRQECAARLAGLPWAWIPYCRPGQPLSQAVGEALSEAHRPDILVLGNHGLVIGAADCGAAEAQLGAVRTRMAVPARPAPAWDRKGLAAVNDQGWTLPDDPALHAIATDPQSFAVAQGGVLYPDHVVFLGAVLPVLQSAETLSHAVRRHEQETGQKPPLMAVPGKGLLVAPDISRGAQAMIEALALVTARLSPADQPRYLDDEAIAALTGWDAEHYRQAVARQKP